MSAFAATPNAHLFRSLRRRTRSAGSAAVRQPAYVATHDYIPRSTADLWRSSRRPALNLPRL
jgi:hypothetical protein